MKGAQELVCRAISYELEIAIEAPRQRVWRAIVDETTQWWLPDFHMVDADSTVEFDTRAGGGLVEHHPAGGSLLWYTIQWFRPDQYMMYLVGQLAPDYGGPSTNHMKIALESGGDDSTVLKLTDAHHGHIEDSSVASLHAGWNQLFREGLKRYVEKA